jgi:hypothetical protein
MDAENTNAPAQARSSIAIVSPPQSKASLFGKMLPPLAVGSGGGGGAGAGAAAASGAAATAMVPIKQKLAVSTGGSGLCSCHLSTLSSI